MSTELKSGRYRIEKTLDEGGMGIVHRAFDTHLNCRVALKQIKPEHLHDPQFRRRLALEAHAAAAISHPGVARAQDFVDDGTEVFVVYEFVEGMNLRKRLGEHRFTTLEILDVGIKLADAMAAAHEEGFIHRDLKPENIMLTPRPEGPDRVKILDFGLAKRTGVVQLPPGATTAGVQGGSITGTGMVIIGTIDYMSPEQVRMEAADHRADLYALGLILYEMATCTNPFRGGEPTSTIANILTREAPPLSELNPLSPSGLDHVVRKCLRKNRDERYQSAKELLVDLTSLRQEMTQPRPADPTPPEPQPPPPIPRRLALALFTLIQVGYLIMYGLGFYFLPENAHRLPMVIPGRFIPEIVAMTLIMLCGGATVRLYLLAAVGFDYEDLGRLFRRIFALVLVLDLAWAISPLLLFHKLGYIVLLGAPALAFLPFSQRTLVYIAYRRRGGRSSAAKAPSAAISASDPNILPPSPPTGWRA